MASNTTASITLATVNGAEYRLASGNWQDSPTFNGLTAGTSYSFTQRLKETSTLSASAASAAANISTVAHTYTISATPTPLAFGTLQSPYTQPALQTVTITRTGTGDVTLAQPSATNYSIGNLSRTVLTAANPTATFTVRPGASLPAGNYDRTITISGTGASSGATATVNTTFTVTPATPALSGTVTINGTATFDQTLTAVTTALTSNPAGTTPTGLTYQWRRGNTDIGGATAATYRLVAADVGATISVRVSASNCTGSVTSSATAAVAKAAQNAPAAPTMASNTTTSITLATVNGAEYRLASGNWQDSPTFNGLTAGTSYSFTQRLKETTTHSASTASTAANISTAAPADPNPNLGLPGDFGNGGNL